MNTLNKLEKMTLFSCLAYIQKVRTIFKNPDSVQSPFMTIDSRDLVSCYFYQTIKAQTSD